MAKTDKDDHDEKFSRQAAFVAHEIRAPLLFIYETATRQLEAECGKRDMPHRARLRELEDILAMTTYAETLVESLSYFDASTPQPRYLRYEPTTVQLTSVAQGMRKVCLPLMRKFGVSPEEIQIDASALEVFIDEHALGQVFLNLVTNSIKYSSVGGGCDIRVNVNFETISVDQLRRMTKINDENPAFAAVLLEHDVVSGILVSVADEGCGIDENDRHRVFDAGHRGTQSSVFGAGLGLTVVKSILEDHRAGIWVERIGAPTKICFFLPDFLMNDRYTQGDFWKGGG